MARILAMAVLATLAIGVAHAESDGEKRRKLMDAAEDMAVVAGASDVCGIDTGRLGGLYLSLVHELGLEGPEMDRFIGKLQARRDAFGKEFLANLKAEGLPGCTQQVRDHFLPQVEGLVGQLEEKARRHAEETQDRLEQRR